MSKQSEQDRFIYAAKNLDSGMIKIGMSFNPRKRAVALSHTEKCQIEILGVILGTTQDEKNLHKKFAASCFKGEWFYPNPDILEFVEQLSAYNDEEIQRIEIQQNYAPNVAANSHVPYQSMDIKKCRKALGWTQAQLAEKLEVHHSIVSRMERGEIPLNVRTLIALEVIFKRAREQ
jgi:DNA-binding transcriptional regulator YiaG